MGILWYALACGIGILIGFLFRAWLVHRHYDGKIVVTQELYKTVYSLELDDYPDTIQFKKEVILKVDASDESLNRE